MSAPWGSTRRQQRNGIWTQFVDLPSIRITARAGPDSGKVWVLTQPCLRIGTVAENDVVLTDPMVSRVHATVTLVERGLRLQDPGSTNGTYVHGVLSRDVVFEGEATFRVGTTELVAEPATERYCAIEQAVDGMGPLVGRSPAMRRIYSMVEAAAPTPVTFMVTGESGTGKELVAQAIHQLSGRKGRLVTFDCAGTAPDLIRSELFGHIRGAFTGAESAREGAFRRAHQGTLFLDELGDLPGALQPLLLRALESRTVQPLGQDDVVPVDVRLVVATHRNLKQMVERKEFRADLYNRLSVVHLEMPPLRERVEDIPLLVESFRKALGLDVRFSPAAIERLQQHRWPGNVRELRNLVERVAAFHRGRVAEPSDLELDGADTTTEAPPAGQLREAVNESEREVILATLRQLNWNKTQAARALGIGLTSLKRKLAEHGITREGSPSGE